MQHLAPALPGIIAPTHKSTPKASADAELIRLIAQRDKNAMQVLFTRHRVQVYRFLLRLTNNRSISDDLLNDVFLKV